MKTTSELDERGSRPTSFSQTLTTSGRKDSYHNDYGNHWLRPRFNWISGVPPRVQSAKQSCCVLKSPRVKCEHRTGARLFGRSSTVGDNHLAFWQLIRSRREFGRRDQDGASDVPLFEGGFVARIDDQHLVLLPKLVQFVRSDAARTL